MDAWAIAVYGAPLLAAAAGYAWRRGRTERRHREAFARVRESGISAPVSMHPEIDHARCVGCGACVHAGPLTRATPFVDLLSNPSC